MLPVFILYIYQFGTGICSLVVQNYKLITNNYRFYTKKYSFLQQITIFYEKVQKITDFTP